MFSSLCLRRKPQPATSCGVHQYLHFRWLHNSLFCVAIGMVTGQFAVTSRADESFGSCIVRAAESITLSSEVAGVVASVDVRLDDTVTFGETLLTLDGRDAILGRQQAEIELRRAEAAVERAKALTVQAKSSVKYRKEDLHRNEQLGSNVLESELRQLRELVERAEVEHVVAYNEYLQAQQLVEAAQLRIQLADLNLSRQVMTSPASGQVSQLVVSPGERIDAGEPLVELRHLDRMLCEIEIDERSPELNRLVGSVVVGIVEVAGQQHQVTGRIVSIGNEVDANGKLTARIELDNHRLENRWLLSHGSQVSLNRLAE